LDIWGGFHVQNYGRIPDVQLVGVMDADSDRGQTVAREFNCEAFSDLKGLFDRVDA